MGPVRIVLLDRDGVINELVPYPPDGRRESPLQPGDVRLADGIPGCLRALRAAGYLLACVTNQPSAAKGVVSVDEIEAVHARVLALLADQGFTFDATRVCLHHPEATVAALKGPCRCRKPAPGMLLEIVAELQAEISGSWMVGDTDADVLAGERAGVRTVLIENPASRHKRSGHVTPDITAGALSEAVPRLLAPFGAG